MTADASVQFRWIQPIAVVGILVLFLMLFLPAIEQSRESARRTQSRNNLKQTCLALWNYQDTFGRLPAGGTFDSEGHAFHGWGLLILPFLEASPIYSHVDFKQPWDAPYNAGCFHIRLPALINPSVDSPSTEGFALSHYSANSNLLGANSEVKLSAIPNSSQTFIAGELGGDFVPWGCPYNWRPLLGLTDTPRTYGRIENYGGHFAMVDGSVRWVSPDVSKEVFTALRGSHLAGDVVEELHIKRPDSFRYPSDARTPVFGSKK